MRLNSERGDTIIEVMVAFAIFAAIAVGSLALMNRGTATAQRALEITLVRAQMDAQTQALNYVHEAYVASYQKGIIPPADTAAYQWWDIKTNRAVPSTAVPKFGQLSAGHCPTALPSKAFIMNAQTAKAQTANLSAVPPTGASLPPFSQVLYDTNTLGNITKAYGLTIQAVPHTDAASGTSFVDFHIRACWDASGSSVSMTLGTIVRLYDPR